MQINELRRQRILCRTKTGILSYPSLRQWQPFNPMIRRKKSSMVWETHVPEMKIESRTWII